MSDEYYTEDRWMAFYDPDIDRENHCLYKVSFVNFKDAVDYMRSISDYRSLDAKACVEELMAIEQAWESVAPPMRNNNAT